jgi:Zn finger protein HypA/HybF involved in hydrogenase expression
MSIPWEVLLMPGQAYDNCTENYIDPNAQILIRYLRADLKCRDCANADFEDDEEDTPCMAGERAEVQQDTTACMAIVFRKEEQ